ncbi:phage integrase Arm DNA-binding domain-containing protein [Bacterioplanoides sp.]|uniref:phage integrase Arm DNA-binding domain-containing protein n=1 Tax=Bacterioplanoides sp. TaxID=2066072 RepID=UPI003B58C27C
MANRSKEHKDLPDNLYSVGGSSPYYRYKHPITGKMHGMGKNRKEAVAAAKKLNQILVKTNNLVESVLNDYEYSVARCVGLYREERQPQLEMKPSTVKLENYRLDAIVEHLGARTAETVSVKDCSDFLRNFQRNAYTKHRATLIKVLAYAESQGWVSKNTAKSTLPLPTAQEKKQRLPLKKEWFDLIYAASPTWLQIAMNIALITLQRRGDLLVMKYSDIKEGYLYIIQQKTEKHGSRAYLKIEIGQALQGEIDRSKTEKPEHYPFMLHRYPKRRIPFKGQKHYGQISEDRLSKSFAKVRDSLDEFKNMPKAMRPTFHEIRGLGGALYLEQGFEKEYVNLLMGHTTQQMTNEYTDQHRTWTNCEANLSIN